MLNDFLSIPLRLPWGELPQHPHVEVTPKIHSRLVFWYTTGFL